MEKHPIDSRFRDGLGGFTPQPSADAWARLQSRMAEEAAPEVAAEEPQKKRFVMWYSIAAAITLLLISVGVYRINFKETETQMLAGNINKEQVSEVQNQKSAETNPVEIAPEKKTMLAQNSTENQIEKANPELISDSKENSGNMVSKKNKTVAKATAANNLKQYVKAEKTVKHGITTSAENQLAKTNKPKATKATETNPETPVSENYALKEETLLAANNPEKAETKNQAVTNKLPENVLEVVVIRNEPPVVLASNQPVNETREKAELLKNIFKQAKNLKNGEKVNLQEIGISPDSKLAMETRNIKQNITQTFTKVLEL